MSGLWKKAGVVRTPGALGAGRVGNKPLFGDDQDGVSCPGDTDHGSGGLLVILNIFPGAPA